MPGRGPQTFKKRQREQAQKERQQEKFERRLARKHERGTSPEGGTDELENVEPFDSPDNDTEAIEANINVAGAGR